MTEMQMTDSQNANVVGVLNISDLVLASLASTAASVVEAVPDVEEVAAAAPEAGKPKTLSEMVAYVHVPDCIACNACADACPSQAIEVEDFSVIDPKICEACNECEPVCPTSCISMKPRADYAQLEFAVTK